MGFPGDIFLFSFYTLASFYLGKWMKTAQNQHLCNCQEDRQRRRGTTLMIFLRAHPDLSNYRAWNLQNISSALQGPSISSLLGHMADGDQTVSCTNPQGWIPTHSFNANKHTRMSLILCRTVLSQKAPECGCLQDYWMGPVVGNTSH